MTNYLRLLTSIALVSLGLLLSGCEMAGSKSSSQEVVAPERPGVTLKGMLTSAGNTFYVKEGTKTTEVTSKKVDLKSRVGTQVEVYGEFSGTTLYVDEVR